MQPGSQECPGSQGIFGGLIHSGAACVPQYTELLLAKSSLDIGTHPADCPALFETSFVFFLLHYTNIHQAPIYGLGRR